MKMTERKINHPLFGEMVVISMEMGDSDIAFSTVWTNPSPRIIGMLGNVFDHEDPRPAEEQIRERFAYGGGFFQIPGMIVRNVDKFGYTTITYPGDPVMHEKSRCYLPLSEETVILFQSDFVAIVKDDGSYKVCRMS